MNKTIGSWSGLGWAVKGRNGGINGIFKTKHKAKSALENLWYMPDGYIERVNVKYIPEETVYEIRALEYKTIKDPELINKE